MKKIYSYISTVLIAVTAAIGLTSCESDDQYLASLLTDRDWQGYLGAYYGNRWNLQGDEYQTVMRFYSRDSYATSGRGYELDYDTRSGYRYQNYAYCEFSWAIVEGDIILIYDDDQWATVYIRDYHLTSSRFRGDIDDGSNRRIVFEFQNVAFDEWDRYGRNAWRTRAAASDSIPYIDNGKSIVSGTFAQR